MPGKIQSVTLQGYTDDRYKDEHGDAFIADLNPGEYTLQFANEIRSEPVLGLPRSIACYAHGKNTTLSMELLFDGTGATGLAGSKGSLRDKIASFRMFMTYDGTLHQPPTVKVSWGGEVFRGYMTQATESYTLFNRSGEPLRVKMATQFIEAVCAQTSEDEARPCSPDVNRIHPVRTGDRLDLVCDYSYKDVRYWSSIARVNRLPNARILRPGQVLRLPRLEDHSGQ